MRDLSTGVIEWHQPARDTAEQFGLDEETVLAAVRSPAHVEVDPSTAYRDYYVERRRRGDVTAIVAFPDDTRPPIIWGVYLNLPINQGKLRKAGSGSGNTAPTTMRELRRRIVMAGLKIVPGGHHDRVETADGRLVASLPRTPSDHRSIPNALTTLGRKGYDLR